MGRPPEEAEVRHAKGLAQKLRDAAAEGQSPWTDEGTCLVFADAAKTLDSLAYGVLAQARVIETLEASIERMLREGHDFWERHQHSPDSDEMSAALTDLYFALKRARVALAAGEETGTPPEGNE